MNLSMELRMLDGNKHGVKHNFKEISVELRMIFGNKHGCKHGIMYFLCLIPCLMHCLKLELSYPLLHT